MALPIDTHRDRLFAIGAAMLVALAAVFTDLVSGFDRWLYDAGQNQTERAPSPDVAVVAIDDASLGRIGPWPWPRTYHARLIDQLSAGGAKVIVDLLPLSVAEDARGLDEIRRLARVAENDLVLGSNTLLAQELQRSATLLDTDTQLANSIARSRRTVLAVESVAGAQPRIQTPPAGIKDKVWNSRLSLVPSVQDFRWPLSSMVRGATGLGHAQMRLDRDETLRTHDLLITGNGRVMPSVALTAAMAFQGRNVASLPLHVSSEQLRIGDQVIATDGPGRVRPQFYAALAAGRAPMFRTSYYEVLSGAMSASNFKDKIVFIGAVTPAVGPAAYTAVDTPVRRNLSQVETLAHVTGSLLSGHSIRHPLWADGVTALATLMVLAVLWWGLPRWTAVPRTMAAVFVVVAGLAAAHIALGRHGLWVPAGLPILTMVAGYLAIGTFHLLSRAAGHVQAAQQAEAQTAQSLRALADVLASQGHADAASAVAQQAARLGSRSVGVVPSTGADAVQREAAAATPLPPPDTLGRYKLEGEIGRGAMGAVFAARDPTIGRAVAIKTMALSREFQGEALEDARVRFFREAELAGRLQHRDIVTIYDAGEEGGLAYIAMERLNGHDLSEYVLPAQRLPVPVVLRVLARVAEALAYAHEVGVVHRDVKPANIVVDLDRDVVKVTDFGIASVVDAPGAGNAPLVGTTYFMSPEQLAGLPLDGRSDLYSLGVTLFQLLTGVLPLRSESLEGFLHAVMHEHAPDVRSLRPELPEALGNIVALALEKRPETRYANGRQLAADLRMVAELIEAHGLPAVVDPEVASESGDAVILSPELGASPQLFGRPA